MASDTNRSAALRSYALQRLPAAAQQPSDEQLSRWLEDETDRQFGWQVVRLLAARQTAAALDQLAQLAAAVQLDPQIRADAVAALAGQAEQRKLALGDLDAPQQPDVVRREVRRVLQQHNHQAAVDKPAAQNLQQWEQLVGSGGDVDAGRRVFFRTRCANRSLSRSCPRVYRTRCRSTNCATYWPSCKRINN